jgi:hypothetical protein
MLGLASPKRTAPGTGSIGAAGSGQLSPRPDVAQKTLALLIARIRPGSQNGQVPHLSQFDPFNPLRNPLK